MSHFSSWATLVALSLILGGCGDPVRDYGNLWRPVSWGAWSGIF
jgi:hypothetical protein